jgi:nucleoside-diphosphate-sugar epimerase
MLVAVTGATGFIGSHLVEALVKLGAEVITMARSESRLGNLASVKGRHKFIECDLSERGAMALALSTARPTIIFHLAAEPDLGESFDQIATRLKTNTFGVLNALEGGIEAGCGRFVLADSCKVYGNQPIPHTAAQHPMPISSYAISKAAAWQLAHVVALQHRLELVSLRLTFVYGARQNWNLLRYVERCALEGGPVLLQGGSQTRDPVYVGDAVSALLAAGVSPNAPGSAIPIGGGVEMTVHDMCAKTLGVLDARLPIVVNAVSMRETEVFRSYSDNRDALRLLGWRPRCTFDDGLRLTFPAAAKPSAADSATADLPG